MESIEYRNLTAEEIDINLFRAFRRRQVVTDCFRRENGEWVIKSDPFIDEWSTQDYGEVILSLRKTASSGGMVYGAFRNGELKGFAAVEGTLTGKRRQYADLTFIYVSEELRGHGIGKELFSAAKRFALEKHAEKLYISAHSAVESQLFYKAMGCTEAEEYDEDHVKREPYDCQLECAVGEVL